MNNDSPISTYHEYILEAIASLRLGLHYLNESKKAPADIGSDYSQFYSHINCRYTFLMIANSLEAAANALLKDLNLEREYYEELERLNTLLKFKIYCDLNNAKLLTSNSMYGRIKDIISCRNEFVHPKPQRVEYSYNDVAGDIQYSIKRSKNRNYPLYFFDLRPNHTVTALQDTLEFLAWVCFDICKMDIQEGALKLGLGSLSSNADILVIEDELGVKFDKRTLGGWTK